MNLNVSDQDWQNLKARVDDTHDGVVRLEAQFKTLFNGGPGSWPSCKQHKEALEGHTKELQEVTRRVQMAMGVVAFISFVGVVVGIYAALHK